MAARYDLDGKVALVTGGASGIGLAAVRRFVAEGARVVVGDVAGDRLATVDDELGDSVATLVCDVTVEEQVDALAQLALDRFDGLHVAFANAGIASKGATMRAMASESSLRVLDVNLMGVYLTVDAALPEIIRRRGHVVVIASVMAFVNGVGAIPYAMSKAGVEQLGRALRVELAQHGASASTAYFGFIDTEMVHQAIDADPLADVLMEQFPRPLAKRLKPAVAGKAIVDGIEGRKARIIRPRRWTAISMLRGILGPLTDAQMLRHAETQNILRQLDERAGEEQPTTA